MPNGKLGSEAPGPDLGAVRVVPSGKSHETANIVSF